MSITPEAVSLGNSNSVVYLKCGDDGSALAAISYCVAKTSNGDFLIRGAYYGYCGGGANDGGYFSKIIGSDEFTLHDYSDVDELEESDPEAFKDFQSMMNDVWIMVEEDEGELVMSEAGQALMTIKGEDNTFMSSEFDGDELDEVSANWSISLRFTS